MNLREFEAHLGYIVSSYLGKKKIHAMLPVILKSLCLAGR